MPGWLAKWMSAEDRPTFQQRFNELFGADPEMALFMGNQRDDGAALLLVPEKCGDLVKDISLGEWQPLGYPETMSWTLLVGRHDARERFGLTN